MESDILIETLPLLGVCNLCLESDSVKSMLPDYSHDGKTENYSEMLMKCFSINIDQMNLGDTKFLICDQCVSKLRSCHDFREQVDISLKTLAGVHCIKLEEKISGETKREENYYNDVDEDDEFCEEDNTALIAIAKIKKEESLLEIKHPVHRSKRRNTTKSKYLQYSKESDYSDTDAMLQAGLFPFKIKKNKTFSCVLCSENHQQLDIIKEHVRSHAKKTIHFAFNKMLLSYSQQYYKSGAKLRCKICTSDIDNYEELRQHIDNCNRLKAYSKSKWNKLPFKLDKNQLDCPLCKKRFLNYVSLNTHMNMHYPNYICESCGKAFASKGRLKGHVRTHEIGEFPCKYCNAVFDKVTKRENHVSKQHKSGVRYVCRRCNISMTSFYARQKHLAEVHNEELKRYKCKACTQSYITPGHLSSHVRRDHLNERNHKCDKCDQAFYTKNSLKNHMIKHDGERIHFCNICQKSYQRKKTLIEHMRIHTNDKRFTCPVCGRAFTQKCTLKGHLKVHERKPDADDKIDI